MVTGKRQQHSRRNFWVWELKREQTASVEPSQCLKGQTHQEPRRPIQPLAARKSAPSHAGSKQAAFGNHQEAMGGAKKEKRLETLIDGRGYG
jgi:hypothetical protein